MNNHLYDSFAHWTMTDGEHKNSVWVYSDPHFADPESMHFRGEEYLGDDWQVKRINGKVRKNDTIIILGDVGDPSFVKRLRGHKVLVMGNHDKGASNYRRRSLIAYAEGYDEKRFSTEWDAWRKTDFGTDGERVEAMFELVSKRSFVDNGLFDEVYEGPIMVNDRLILSHEPIEPLPETMFNVHGHVHGGSHDTGPRTLNVCAESIGYEPVSLTSMLAKGLLSDVPSPHRVTIDKAKERKSKCK